MSCSSSRPRRRPISWPVCLAIISLASAIGFAKPTGNADFSEAGFPSALSSSTLSSSSPPQAQRKTLDQEVDSPSELAWRAWLLVENKGGGQAALDSSNILRRITPKSIFIAPELVNCPSGYSIDGKGGCKPDPISIDEDAQRQFWLKRLNILYGKNGNNRKKPAETGPLQINIPFSLPAKTNPPEKVPLVPQQEPQQTPTQKPEQETPPVDRVAIPVVISQQAPTQLEDNKDQEAVAVVVYKVTNNTKKDEKTDDKKTTFYPSNSTLSNSKKETTQTGHVIPVAEIVDDDNDTFSGVVDYKIPLSIKAVLNQSDTFTQTKIESTRYPTEKKVDSSDSMEDSSPTVVLLLSPTKLSTTIAPPRDYELAKVDRLTTKQDSDQRENTTFTDYEEETKFEADTTIQTVSPLDAETAVDQVGVTTLTSTEKAYTDDRLEEDTAYTDEETQTEPVSDDHEEYDDTTEEVDQDDFSESDDELLKPGEAGMMIPTKNQDLVKKSHKHHMPTTLALEDITSTTLVETTTPPVDAQNMFVTSDSTIKSESTSYTKEDITSTVITEIPTVITTESSADDIATFATKPFKAENLMSTTRTHPTQTPTITVVDNREKTDAKETFETEKDLVTEPEVIFSTQGSHSMTTSYGRKRPTHPAKVIETPHTVDDLEESVLKTEIPSFPEFLRQPEYKRPKPPITAANNKPNYFKNDGNIPSEFKDQIVESSRPAFTDFRRIPTISANDESYVRFPEQQTTELRSQQNGYVRFPSDEVNSIHNQDTYKEHLLLPFRSRDDYNNNNNNNNNSPTSTKSSVPARQKQPSTQWRVPPPGIRMDRQQQQQIQSSSGSQRQQQKQKPMLLRFWARMPLVRDLSFYPTTSHGSHNEPIGGSDDTHRLNSRFSQSTTASARRVNYYKEMSTHDVNRLLAQQLAQPAIGG